MFTEGIPFTGASLGFAMAYRSFHCLSQIDITIGLANGDSLQREFNM
jgi:hypothetical protein